MKKHILKKETTKELLQLLKGICMVVSFIINVGKIDSSVNQLKNVIKTELSFTGEIIIFYF